MIQMLVAILLVLVVLRVLHVKRVRRWLEARDVYWFWVNDNHRHERRTGRKGTILRAGRLCLHLRRFCPRIEWCCTGRIALGCRVRFGGTRGENAASCSLVVPFVDVDLRLEHWPTAKLIKRLRLEGRELGGDVFWQNGGIVVSMRLWSHDETEGDYRLPWWRQRCFYWTVTEDLADVLFGLPLIEQTIVEEHDVGISFVEGTYPAKVRIVRNLRSRQRLPFMRKAWLVAEVEVTGQPPQFRGKGENAWDTGNDAISLLRLGQCETWHEAVGQYVARVLSERGPANMVQQAQGAVDHV